MEKSIFGRRWSVWMADTVLAKFKELRKSWSYDYGVICKGMEMVYELVGKWEYFEYIRSNMDYFVQDDGTIKMYDLSAYNLDYINNGKALLYLYTKTRKEKYAKAAHLLKKQLETHPRTTEGGFWHKKRYPHQMWLDGLYMAEPFYAQYLNLFSEKSTTTLSFSFA